MPRLAFFTFAILREAYGHPRVKGFFDRVAANFAAAERCDGYIDRSELIPGTQAHTWGEPVAPRFFREGEPGGAPRSLSLWRDLDDHGPVELDRTRVKALVRKNAGTPPV